MNSEEKDLSLKHLAHDLNNIFTRIFASIELLKLKNRTDENYASLLNNIESGAYLASEIINTTIGKSSASIQNRRININTIIQDVVNSYQGYANGKINFSLSLQPNLKLINAKYVDISRIVMNLITNALESIENAGNVSIKTFILNNDQLIKIIIADDGVGIDENLYNLIFAEGFSTKPHTNKSGYGLSIVKSLVELYKGTIDVQSSKQKGTQFTLTFPAAVTSKVTIDSSKTVLIAEDENTLRYLLTELLQSYNYKVVSVSNGKEALELFATNRFDVLIIDKIMPQLDGIECIKQIRKQNYNIPIILASGSSTADSSLINALNISYVLNKPYNFDEMISVIEDILT
ncbi:MAG: PAS/PAC sensor hybrid histidine kinase [Ignavibacteria bacterium]|nr:MAG: PAS/PAC sensor hybrid histidine kinase [Ignavibacteria bacterium]KAF0160599.1 MAG: PAS/PAC sensor hybrid histidine kinase [Ignavibacteria bacterium]